MKKLKVAWICHFSNKEVREELSLSKMKIRNFIKFNFWNRKVSYKDFAPWVTSLIREFEKLNDIELHVISPHKGLNKPTYQYIKNGVYYHFFNPDYPFFLTKLTNIIFKVESKKYRLNRFFVKRFIKEINPDIVNLIGTENPYYSITVLDIINIPVFISVQTVYTNPQRLELSGGCNKLKWNIELIIHKKEKYFGCGGRMHYDLILRNNPNAIIFKNNFPIQKIEEIFKVEKEYDFVFFAASVTKKKGIEDAIEALAIVKKEKKNVLLNIVGSCSTEYKKFLMNKIIVSGLKENVAFNDYFPVHTDLHKHILKSKIAVLPVKLDLISSAVIEAILLGLPVVTYKTPGMPYLNRDGESVLVANIGDINELSKNMIKVLDSTKLANMLRENAKSFVEKEFDSVASAKRLVNNYRAVINHFHNNIPIPQELLFNTVEYPIY
jgi:glycosyltransferase involved in cell wall biosynthesis